MNTETNEQYEMRIKDLEARLQYQKKLCEDLQQSILFDNSMQKVAPVSAPVQESKTGRRPYSKKTPLKEYLEENKENEEMLKELKKLPGLQDCKKVPLQLVRSYLTVLFRNKMQSIEDVNQ
jgi:hypothetical protein